MLSTKTNYFLLPQNYCQNDLGAGKEYFFCEHFAPSNLPKQAELKSVFCLIEINLNTLSSYKLKSGRYSIFTPNKSNILGKKIYPSSTLLAFWGEYLHYLYFNLLAKSKHGQKKLVC